jgi:hypothetical protein
MHRREQKTGSSGFNAPFLAKFPLLFRVLMQINSPARLNM